MDSRPSHLKVGTSVISNHRMPEAFATKTVARDAILFSAVLFCINRSVNGDDEAAA